MNTQLPRDLFIETILAAAKKDKSIYFISADLGAKALDAFRSELPEQFIHAGISEQNMIDVAAGLAMTGNKVFCYAMAPFITSRCLEQIKVAIASHNLPVTLIGVGVGFGYDNAGPTHYATEDITWMSSLAGIEIYSPANNIDVKDLANKCIKEPSFRYIRLDRQYIPELETLNEKKGNVLILSTGFMTKTIHEALDEINRDDIVQVDVLKNFPIEDDLIETISSFQKIITAEEHFLSGGFSSKICEVMSDNNLLIPHLRIGVREKYYFENGGREYIHQLAKIDKESVKNRIIEFVGNE